MSKTYNIRTVVVLPSAMIGAEAYKLSYSNKLVHQILNKEIPVDTNITLNWIDVKDVALGLYSAMLKGKNRARYILANKKHTSMQESVKIASALYPELNIKEPKKVPKKLLYIVAVLMELASKISDKEPKLQRQYLDMFYGLKQDYDTSNSEKDLDFYPKSSKKALEEALNYLKNDWDK